MTVHAFVSEDHCYHCSLRAKGVSVSPSAMPSRCNNVPPRKPDPAWERGIVGEHRPDGSFMPVLAPGAHRALHVKEYGEDRRNIDSQIRDVRQGIF